MNNSNLEWDIYFLELCVAVAKKSKDPSTKVGAIIVGDNKEIRSTGWNGFPRGVNDLQERYNDRPLKYQLVCHAEANAIANAARVGTPLDNCTLYVTPLFVCNDCAKLIIQVGIKEVVMINFPEQLKIWKEKMAFTEILFTEAKVTYRLIDENLLFQND